MILQVVEMDRLMGKHYNIELGSVILQDVEREMKEQGADIGETLLHFCGSNGMWAGAALPIMYGLIERGELTEEQARRFLPIVEVYGPMDVDEYYTTIRALGQQKYAPVLIELAEKLLKNKEWNVHGWRWLVYSVVAEMIGRRIIFTMPTELAASIIEESYKEEDSRRRDQLIFLAGRLAENQELYLA